MTLAEQLYNIYNDLYNESTNAFWEEHATRLNYSTDILKDIFGVKDDELTVLESFITNYLSEKVLLQELLNECNQNNIEMLDIDTIREGFSSIMDRLNPEDVQDIIDDEELYYFSVAIAEAILIALEETLLHIIRDLN